MLAWDILLTKRYIPLGYTLKIMLEFKINFKACKFSLNAEKHDSSKQRFILC